MFVVSSSERATDNSDIRKGVKHRAVNLSERRRWDTSPSYHNDFCFYFSFYFPFSNEPSIGRNRLRSLSATLNPFYPFILERFKKSMQENDLNGIFNNVLLIAALTDSHGQEVFDLLKMRFKDDASTMESIKQYETQFKDALKKS